MFEVGALIFKIQTAGAQLFQRDLADADKAVEKVTRSTKAAKPAIEEQGKATEELGKKSRRASDDQEIQRRATEGQVQAAKNLSLALIAGGVALTALVGMSVAKYASFDAQMSNVRAATMATTEEQKALGEAALQAGADTAYSANEAAAAEEELAKAGMSVSEVINGGLTGALSLAAAGQLQVARSAEIMATTMNQFKLPAEEAARVSDVLAAGAGKAQGSVDDLALALSYTGPLAAQAGWSLEETAGVLSYFASQGILGEKAGTAMRGVLAALQAPSSIAAKAMEQYGLTIYDANGKMLSAEKVAGNMARAFGGLTQEERNAALGRIFGNESLLAATLLYEGGADAISKATDQVSDYGYAAEQATMRQDNLAGDIEKLGGAFDTALIKTGSGANDVLRDMVQTVTSLVDGYGELPDEVQAGALAFGVVAGAMALTSGAAVGLRTKYVELSAQLDKTNFSLGKTALIGGAVGLAFAGVISVLTVLAQRQAEAESRVESFRTTLDQATGAITDSTREMAVAVLQADQGIDLLFGKISRGNAADAAERLGLSMTTVTDAAVGQADALDELSLYLRAAEGDEDSLQQVMRDTNMSRVDAANAVSLLSDAIDQSTGGIDDARRTQEQANKATEEAVPAAKSAADAYLEAADGAQELNGQIQSLIDQINEANGVGQDAVTTNARYQEALASIADQAAEMGTSLDQSTVAGSANAAMLAGVAADAQKAAEAQLEVDKSTMSGTDAAKKYAATLAAQRQEFIDSAVAAGYNKNEVTKLADEIFSLPPKKTVEVIAETAEAQRRLQGIADTLASFRNSTFGVNLSGYMRSLEQKDGGVVTYYAGGGVRENHVAQIARAGEWRVWAEPETGGEAYIPLAESKRGRSEAILTEVAGQFGGVYIPASAVSYADGSPVSSTPPSTPTGRVVTNQITFVNPVVRDLQQDAWEAAQIIGGLG